MNANEALREILTTRLLGMSSQEQADFLQAVRDNLPDMQNGNGDKAKEETAQAQRQAELRQAYLRELSAGKGSWTQQYITRQKFLKLGYDPSKDETTPEAQWQKGQDESKAAKQAFVDDLAERKAQAYGAPAAKKPADAKQAELLEAYTKQIAGIKNLRGQAFIEAKQKIKMKFYKMGYEGDLD